MYFCVNTYAITTTNGSVRETVISSSSHRNLASYGNSLDSSEAGQLITTYGAGTPLEHNATRGFEAMKAFNETFGNSLWTRPGSLARYSEPLNRFDLQLTSRQDDGTEKPFNISVRTIQSTIQYILNWSVGQESVKRAGDGSDLSDAYNPLQGPPPLLTGTVNNATVPGSFPIFSTLYQSPNLTSTFSNISKSMSSYFRTIDGQVEMVNGTAQQWITHTKVQWPYLIVTSVALLATYIYVLLAIWQTRSLRLPAWKESIVATLVFGLDESGQSLLRDPGSEDMIDAKTMKTARAQLVDAA